MHVDKRDGIFGFDGTQYRFLSNFYGAPVKYLGIIWPTAEHAYQAMKTRIAKERDEILAADTPGKAKRIGQKVKMRVDWDFIKDDVMYGILSSKFSDFTLSVLLLTTNDKYLEETNTWNDTYWGVCNGVGQNKLGLQLMKIRDILTTEK